MAKQKEREEREERKRAELARKRAEKREAEKRKAEEEQKNAPNIDRKATDRLGEVSYKGVDESELPKNMAFRVTDANEVDDILKTGGMRRMSDGEKVEGAEIEMVESKNGGSFKIGRDEGRDHGGKAFSKGVVWTNTAGGSGQKVIIGVPGEKTQWRVGFHGKYTKSKPWGEIEDGKPLLLEFGEDGRVEGLSAKDMRFWVLGRDGKYYELTPKSEAPKKEAPKAEERKKGVFDKAAEIAKTEEKKKAVADLEKEFNDANDHLGDLEDEWRDRILDYVDEHYPTQSTVSAETKSKQGLKEREAMKKDPVLAKLRADAKKAIDEADDKVGEVFDRLEKAEAEERRKEAPKDDAPKKDKDGERIGESKKIASKTEAPKKNGGLAENKAETQKEGTTLFGRLASLFSPRTNGRKAAERVAKAFGYKVKWVDSDSEYNGRINYARKTITISKDAEMPIIKVFGHELTHAVRKLGEEQYNALRDAVKAVLGDKELERRMELKRSEKSVATNERAYKEDEVEEEVIADAVGDIVNSEDNLRRLAERLRGKPSILARIREALKKLLGIAKESGDGKVSEETARRMKVLDAIVAAAESRDGRENGVGDEDYSRKTEIGEIIADAKKKGTYMLAPNGKKSKLEERQWAHVRTKAFKNWFGDWENDPENASKIVDENGEPMVVYHDTNSMSLVNRKTGQNFNYLSKEERLYWETEASSREFEDAWEERPFYTFDNQHYGRISIEMPAFFFTPIYDEYHEYGDRTISVFLNVRNPIENPEIPNAGVTNTAGEDAMKRYIEMGYDGFIRKYDGVVEETNAFSPNQIKSAEENDGSYSPKNNDIRYSVKTAGTSNVTGREAKLRDALVERMRKADIDVSTDAEEVQRVLDEANGKTRLMSFGEPYDYETYPLGRVEPDLSEKSVELVNAGIDHGFSNYKEARTWAKQNIAKTYNSEETGGKGDVRISNAAIDKFLSQSAVDKSDSKDVHMAVLKVLPDVLRTSIDVETHPDFLKGEDGNRNVENGINKDVLVHRCYGAVSVDGKLYRVKITLKENIKTDEITNTHSYEATKIELLAGQHGDVTRTSPRNSNSSISVAKLLKNVGMSYNSSEKILDASKKRSKTVREQRVFHGSGADFDAFDHSHMGEGEGAQAYGWGTYVTEVEGIGRMYAEQNSKMYDNPVVRKMVARMQDMMSEGKSFEEAKSEALERMRTTYEKVKDRDGYESFCSDYEKLEGMTESEFQNRHLYTVEIPDDTGENYLSWDGRMTDRQKNNDERFEEAGSRLARL